jgi:hypothetical protein
MQNIFGAGVMWARPLQDAYGNAISNPTPVKIGAFQEVSFDFSFDTKTLYGSNQFPIAVGRGKGKVAGKAKFGQVNGMLLNGLVFGQTLNSGAQTIDYNDTSTGVAIPASPYTITIAPPNSGTYAKDLGVRNAATGLFFTRVASGPTAGQYSVNESTGVYTFSSADNASGVKVQIDYQYTATVSGSTSSTVQNLPMGYAPTFGMDVYMPYNGKNAIFTFPNCTASKLGFATKLDDFALPEIDIEAFASASGQVVTYSLSE